jgi:hypothetical protein
MIQDRHGQGEGAELEEIVGRVTRLLIVLALGLSAARWIGTQLNDLRHEAFAKTDAFVTSNAGLIGQILLVLGVTAIEGNGRRLRRALAARFGPQPGQQA